ncbi:hypothetical protein [Noviherbaspirillum soli]|uniref:hypothetical protein n=1 Tax=Noviherbaspirillum soli TaxID=1064518 RepID=UPI00188C0CE1|nr:hypothetical protein [Noviherbaspirillum soli]
MKPHIDFSLAKGNSAGQTGHLREKMPGVTAWIDSLREAFGKEMVDQMIRTGLRKGTFWAVENGLVVGQPPTDVLEKHRAGFPSPVASVEIPEKTHPEPVIDRRWPS